MPSDEVATFEVDFAIKERAMDEAPVGITISDPDRPDNPLVYANAAFERITGYPVEEIVGRNCRFLQGEGSDPEAVAAMREAVEAAEPVSVELVNYRKDGTEFWNEVTIAPLRDGEGEVTHFVGFQVDVTARKRAEFAVERERERLDRLLDRIDGLMGDVTAVLVGAVSREEIERAVTGRLATADPYVGAWIGTTDLARDVVVPRSSAGAVAVDGLEIDANGPDPVARAIETGEPRVLGEVPGEPLDADHARRLDGAGSMAAIPLAYRESGYGALVVYAAGADAIDGREAAVLQALGRAVATAMNALETRRVLVADSVLEVEFAVRDAGFFPVGIAGTADCRLEYVGSAYRSDGSPLLFFAAEGAPPERVLEAAAGRADVADAALLTHHGETSLVELAPAEGGIVAWLAEHGGETRAIVADPGEACLGVTFPSGTDVRAVLDRLRERYPGTELVAYAERERPPETKREYVAALEEQLTDRQHMALQKAYVGGYFDRSRRITGDELADSMGITRSTFHQHLRAGQRKLLAELFDREPDR